MLAAGAAALGRAVSARENGSSESSDSVGVAVPCLGCGGGRVPRVASARGAGAAAGVRAAALPAEFATRSDFRGAPGVPWVEGRFEHTIESLGVAGHDRDGFVNSGGCGPGVALLHLRYIPAVDNSTVHVDAFGRQTFFLTQPVDGIKAGRYGRSWRPFRCFPSEIPSLPTGTAACLHKLSTDLCTARVDVRVRTAEDCRSHPLEQCWGRVRVLASLRMNGEERA